MRIPTIGLELHIELKTLSKMFCSCSNDPDAKQPNMNVCPICMGHPGTLPVINEAAVKAVIKTGLALNCQIPESSKFDRKNYFYPDLPKGYQISQYDEPLCLNGEFEIDGKKIRIRRIHLEEDTGRLLHPEGEKYSLVDFNRAGVPLMELVTEPDITSAKEARAFSEELQLILRYLGVSTADMEKGQLRCEVNISLSEPDAKLGTKVEVKNLNSFRAVEKSTEFEMARQTEILESGGEIRQETRGWNDKKNATVSQREKEAAHDYRYFPEPDLPALRLGELDFIAPLKAEIPELPQARRTRLILEYGIKRAEAEIFTTNKDLGEYFEKVVSELGEWAKSKQIGDMKIAQTAANYIVSDLVGLFDGAGFNVSNCRIAAENFAEFISIVHQGEISSKIAKSLLFEMFKTGEDPSHIIEEKGLSQMTDISEIEQVVATIIEQNPKAVADYKTGKQNALQFLVGMAMAKTKGLAEPNTLRELFKKLLN